MHRPFFSLPHYNSYFFLFLYRLSVKALLLNLKLSKLPVRTCLRLPFYNIGLHKILSYGRFNIIAQKCTREVKILIQN